MATAQVDTVVRHFRQAVLQQDGADRTDAQLLVSFIDQKDEAAFAALIQRHGPMVIGIRYAVAQEDSGKTGYLTIFW